LRAQRCAFDRKRLHSRDGVGVGGLQGVEVILKLLELPLMCLALRNTEDRPPHLRRGFLGSE
jgi:hypothetical protein